MAHLSILYRNDFSFYKNPTIRTFYIMLWTELKMPAANGTSNTIKVQTKIGQYIYYNFIHWLHSDVLFYIFGVWNLDGRLNILLAFFSSFMYTLVLRLLDKDNEFRCSSNTYYEILAAVLRDDFIKKFRNKFGFFENLFLSYCWRSPVTN